MRFPGGLALGLLCTQLLGVMADKLHIERCFCANERKIGFVTTYYWNSTSLQKDFVLPWASSTLRDDGMKGTYAWYCPSPGKLTKADCRQIPYMPGYDMTRRATPHYIDDHCFDRVDGHKYCLSYRGIRMDKKRITNFPHDIALENRPLLDYDASCRAYWSDTPDTFLTCSYTNFLDNGHYGERTPFGYEYNKKNRLVETRTLMGCAEWDVNWTPRW